ncbi:MAG: formate dehydrogenase accessory sulfurtransferase FdhD [Candidatus Desulfaltia sp.]|nr:formate dehydrogenase accessory sulfurtransferase FdhD [Candidatus Desulfaltia sp.]
MNTFLNHQVVFIDKKNTILAQHKLINEKPLSILVQGKPYCVIMRTPGNELQHVAGFSLYEELIDIPDDLTSLSFKDDADTNVVAITLSESRKNKISHLLERQDIVDSFYYQNIPPMADEIIIDVKSAVNCLEGLSNHQPLRSNTHAAHAAALYNSDFELLSVAEDVGRHNAVDKAIGKLFLDNTLNKASLLILSSRISYELVKKAARARIPVILAMSRPTSIAVEIATKLNMTLACLAKGSGLYIFCGKHRFGKQLTC